MASTNQIKVTFTLDESDLAYFRDLFKKVRKNASAADREQTVADVKALIGRVRSAKKMPHFVMEAVGTLEALIGMLEDADYQLPPKVGNEILAALAYFSNPHDLVPDTIPGLGFLDDAIMVKFLEDQFQYEIAGYRKFQRFREGANVRPWAPGAGDRLSKRLVEKRKEIRQEIAHREAGASPRRRLSDLISW